MRHDDTNYDAFEMLHPESDSSRYARPSTIGYDLDQADIVKPSLHDEREDRRTRASHLQRLPGIKQLLYYVPIILCIIPFAVLLGYAPQLSRQLSDSACTPGGELVMPYNSSVWDSKGFFEINIPFLGPHPDSCTSSINPLYATDCLGYSFTDVKVIGLAWDLLVGRGGQAVLIVIAYHLFSRVMVALMEQGEIGYDAFAAVAFATGSFNSIIPLFRQAAGLTPIPRTRRAISSYVGMLLPTIYIVAVPSLISAMTGYTSRYTPNIRTGSVRGLGSGGYNNGTLISCETTFVPVWGRMGIDMSSSASLGGGVLSLSAENSNVSFIDYDYGSMWIDYYDRYKDIYDECPKELNISSCRAARQDTELTWTYSFDNTSTHTVYAPMPGIVPFNNITDYKGNENYAYWMRGSGTLVSAKGLLQSPLFDEYDTDEAEQGVGVCQADSRYAWGFSFLFTFLVAVLQLVFAILLYALWLFNRSLRKASLRPVAKEAFPDAVTMVTQAQKQYGGKLDEWGGVGLRREILHGKVGMSFIGDEGLRRRRAQTSETLGDAYRGDWGGNVVVENGR